MHVRRCDVHHNAGAVGQLLVARLAVEGLIAAEQGNRAVSALCCVVGMIDRICRNCSAPADGV
jgi:hypothetical protein